MIRIAKVLCGFFIFLPVWLGAQPWLQEPYLNSSAKKNATYTDIKEAFYKYWSEDSLRSKFKTGYKPFRRAIYDMDMRTGGSGNIPEQNILLKEYRAYKVKRNKVASHYEDGANWYGLGPNDIPSNGGSVGRISSIAFDPTDANVVWAGAASGGLWKSIDGGTSWSVVSGMDVDFPVTGINDIEIDPNDNNIIYVATGDANAIAFSLAYPKSYSYGILKSIDGGLTWSQTGLQPTIDQLISIRQLAINKQGHLLAASSNGIYKSIDGGSSFNLVNNTYTFTDIEVNPLNDNMVFASTYDYTSANAKILKSTDGGNTFNVVASVSSTIRIELGLSIADTSIVYGIGVSASTSGLSGVFKSTNSGQNFSSVPTSLDILGSEFDGFPTGGQGWFDLDIAVSPVNAQEVFVGGINVWKTTNGGTSWTLNTYFSTYPGTSLVHADIHVIKYSPINSSTMMLGCDGGLYKTTNSGVNWTDNSKGLNVLQTYRIGLSTLTKGFLLAGAQDNYINKLENNFWSKIGPTRDGMESIINPTDNNIMYWMHQSGELKRSLNGGLSYVDISPAVNGDWVTPFIMSPSNSQTLYAGYKNVYKTTNQGVSWNPISNFSFSEPNINAIEISEQDENYIYLTNYLGVYKTTDGGTTINWTNITPALTTVSTSTQYYTSITTDPADKNRIWLTLSGFLANNKVYQSLDGGINWTNISGTLPNVPVYDIVYEKGSNDGIYVATELGIFYRNANFTDWEPFQKGMPAMIVKELEIDNVNSRIYAATFARGVWHSNTWLPIPLNIDTKSLQDNSTTIYPNPTSGESLTIDLGSDFDQSKKYNVIVYNLLGEQLLSVSNIDNKIVRINKVNDLLNGTYFLKILANNIEISSQKLLIIK